MSRTKTCAKIAAIDPGLTNTAVCAGDQNSYEMKCFRSTPHQAGVVSSRIHRMRGLAARVSGFALGYCPELTLVEGYSFGSRNNRELLGEYGGLLRARLMDRTQSIVEVPPTTLKRFCTGKGNASKLQMAACCAKRWGVEFKTDDEYDAFALFEFGLAATGAPNGTTQEQSRIAADWYQEYLDRLNQDD